MEVFNEYVVAMEDRVEVSRNDKEIKKKRDAKKIEALIDDRKRTCQENATLAALVFAQRAKIAVLEVERDQEILESLKEELDEVSAEIQLQEVVANIDLLNELKDGGLTVDAELPRLKEMEKDCEDPVTLAALDLPQVSEDSVDQAGGRLFPMESILGLSQYYDRFLFPPVEKTWHREGQPFVNPNGYEIDLVVFVRNTSDLGEDSAARVKLSSPTGSEGRDRPPQKEKMNGSDHILGVSSDTADCPITEDPDSVAHLVRHFNPAGCPLPSLRNMMEREGYLKVVVAHATVVFLIIAMEANNEFAATLEWHLQDIPRSDKLYEIKKDQERASAAQLSTAEKLGNHAATSEARIQVVSNERKSALENVSYFEAKVESFANKFSDDLRHATYDAKKVLEDSYLDVLVSLKEKWEKKKTATDCEARLSEFMANIDLLKEIMNNNHLSSDELLHLRRKEIELGSKLDLTAVSDFSVGKLDLPQISEDLPVDFFVKVPYVVNDTGDEMKRAGGQFEDGKFDIEE
ncbi:hypothetical protein IGI04_023213 [Brassica rapa subsp. trilocularis]|uniref:Uncharacterized protein n=1 Tax=Brassica rapa subsp. trilocularis TaxID=1813537 RepID=A0ABQ7M5S4_BRACM|nr:hypothetical protein IGI04_023213 [Brassica rapa subsp. trilocularis]